MAKLLKINAIRVSQKRSTEGGDIYIARLRAGDLIDKSQFVVDLWDPAKRGKKDQGYQREINERRARTIATFIETNEQAIFPTAVLISSRKPLDFQDRGDGSGELIIGNRSQYPLYIIDGQHRIGGLRHAIEKDGATELSEMELPVVILSDYDKLEEVRQFFILNTCQKKVNTSLAQRLIADIAGGDSGELARVKDAGKIWEISCLKIIDMLNEKDSSPWKGKIKIPHSDKKVKHIINQTSFLVSLKPLFAPGAVFSIVRDLDKQYEIVEGYWLALEEVFSEAFSDPKNYIIQKTPGIFSLHGLAPHLIAKIGLDKVSKDSFKKVLTKMTKGTDVSADWWRKDNYEGAGQYGSMKGFKIMTDQFIDMLDEAEL